MGDEEDDEDEIEEMDIDDYEEYQNDLRGGRQLHHGGMEEEDDEEEAMISPVDEKKLTKAEKSKKEDIIKAMAMKSGGKDKMGPKQYAIATAQAKKSAE